jgi:hypothetical protein
MIITTAVLTCLAKTNHSNEDRGHERFSNCAVIISQVVCDVLRRDLMPNRLILVRCSIDMFWLKIEHCHFLAVLGNDQLSSLSLASMNWQSGGLF